MICVDQLLKQELVYHDRVCTKASLTLIICGQHCIGCLGHGVEDGSTYVCMCVNRPGAAAVSVATYGRRMYILEVRSCYSLYIIDTFTYIYLK